MNLLKRTFGIISCAFAALGFGTENINSVYDGKSDVLSWQIPARKKLIRLLGIEQMLTAKTCDLAPQSIWKRETPDGTIEKIRLQMSDDFANHIYLCIPKNAVAPHNVFICLQGHSTGMHTSIAVQWQDETTPLKVAGDRDFAIYCMRKGITAICLEQRSFGENSTNTETREKSCRQDGVKELLMGRTLLGNRVFDIKRVIDYIKSNPQLDSSKIGIMGNSGGGTTAMFAGAILPELTHIMPSCSFSSFKASIYDRHHCVCNYVPGLMKYGESADVLGLIAPRPLVIVNGQNDSIFPIEEAKSEFERIKNIYNKLNAGSNCQHVIGPEGHRFYADPAWAAMLPLWNKK